MGIGEGITGREGADSRCTPGSPGSDASPPPSGHRDPARYGRTPADRGPMGMARSARRRYCECIGP